MAGQTNLQSRFIGAHEVDVSGAHLDVPRLVNCDNP